MSGHTIELQLDADGVNGLFHCHEGPTSKCHATCTEGCPVWDEECTTNHARTYIDYCNPIEFVDNSGYWYETYVGEKDVEPHSGPIVFEWQSNEWYGWRYAEEHQ